MTKLLSLSLALILGSTSLHLFAGDEGDTYFGGAYHMGKYKESGVAGVSPTGLKVFGGKYIADNVAIEGSFILGIGEDDASGIFEGLAYAYEVELANALSVFVKADAPLDLDAVNLYGKLGFTKAKIEFDVCFSDGFDILCGSGSESDSGLSYGIGVAFNLNDEGSIVVEYISYLDESDYSYTGIDIGYKMNY